MMEKYSVDRRKVQEQALAQVRMRLTILRAVHEKTASQNQELEALQAQELELEGALSRQ